MSKAFETLIPEATEEIRPFHISVPQEAIADLRARLRATRFPNEQPVKDWSQGVPLAQAEALVQYWESRYDWRRFETELNSFQHFRTLIDGLGIHFIHARSPHTDALPIILTHGWPGSIAEFIKIIRPLTNPTDHGGRAQDAFHVVVPSLPGFGFSDKPTETGWNVSRIAFAWSELMQRLGYQRWVAQGGDWGAGTTTALAQRFRCELRGQQTGRVEVHADHSKQSFQGAPAPGRSDHFMRALVSPISAVVRTCRGVGGRTWCGGGCQLPLALGAGVCTRVEQTLPAASEADQQELSDRRDVYKGEGRGQISVSRCVTNVGGKPAELYRRWERASRSRLSGVGFKPPGAAAFKRRGGERPRKRRPIRTSGEC